MIELPAEILADWSGRFRFRGLLVARTESGSVDLPTAAASVLDGLVASQDELAVFDRLVSDGEFDLAETMLDECPALLALGADEARARIDRERANRIPLLASIVQNLYDTAEVAGFAVELDSTSLEERSQRSWVQVDAVLDRERAALTKLIADRTNELRARMDRSDHINASTKDVCAVLLDSGQLRTAERLLDTSRTDIPLGPESMPRLRPWIWSEQPNTVLQWHTHARHQRPSSFRDWIPEDQGAKWLLTAFQRLSDGVGGAAQEVAVALNRFLGAELDERAEVHAVSGGVLAKLHNLFEYPPTRRFHPTGTVELFVAEPGVTQIPTELAGMEPFVALGPTLVGRAQRGELAVLGVRDLLRLVLLSRHRATSLLGLLGPQWPLSALSAGSAERLRQLLEPDYDARWRALSWLVYLARLGDATTTDEITFQTGLDADLIDLLLNRLVRAQAGESKQPPSDVVRCWLQEARLSAIAESAVLEPIRHSPVAVFVFWAALFSAPPGQPVLPEEILLTAEIVTDVPVAEADVRAGLAELADMWLVTGGDGDTIRFRRCGALIALRAAAESRLADAARLMAARAVAATDPVSVLSAWDLHRHALSPARQTYRQLVDGPAADAAAVAAAMAAMVEQTASVLTSSPVVTGRTDVVAVLRAMQLDFTASHQGQDLTVDAPEAAIAAVGPELVEVLIHELVDNAREALLDAGEGTISIALMVARDVIVNVRDSGPGIGIDGDSAYLLFRSDFSTRGPGRGQGLYLARRLALLAGGELDVDITPPSHPILRGAHFRLVLPST